MHNVCYYCVADLSFLLQCAHARAPVAPRLGGFVAPPRPGNKGLHDELVDAVGMLLFFLEPTGMDFVHSLDRKSK